MSPGEERPEGSVIFGQRAPVGKFCWVWERESAEGSMVVKTFEDWEKMVG